MNRLTFLVNKTTVYTPQVNAKTSEVTERTRATHSTLIDEARRRAKAYTAAGASGFFVSGLLDKHLISELCEKVELPVNIMMMDGVPPLNELAQLGVSRISYGPAPYFSAMHALTESATAVYESIKLPHLSRPGN